MTTGKKPTELLKEEHENVLQKLDALEVVIGHLDRKEEVFPRLKELASFFQTDFWVHFVKEEEALFPELERFIPGEGGPLGVMLMEHEELRDMNAAMQGVISDYMSDALHLEVAEMTRKHGSHFIRLLRDHIDKENSILFAIADMHLDQTQVEKVTRLFTEIEKSGVQVSN